MENEFYVLETGIYAENCPDVRGPLTFRKAVSAQQDWRDWGISSIILQKVVDENGRGTK